jgi:Domain of unknown function (DUF4879)
MNRLRNVYVGTLLLAANVALAEPAHGGRFEGLDVSELRQRMIEQHEEWKRQNAESNGVVALAPAPSITQLQVYAVRSANYPSWEYLSSSQYSTTIDHGGSWMDLVTYQYGYGNNPICKLNSVNLSNWHTEYITDSAGTIIGFIYYWIADGHQGGKWTYQDTSMNSPFNTMSDWATVK